MSNYPAFICENGHEISSRKASCTDAFCSQCGARVINKCPECQCTIRGLSMESYGFIVDYDVPAYCRSCGKPYPWTVRSIESTVIMLQESDLSFDDQQKLIDILPDALSETPKTQLASIRFQKAIANAGNFVGEGLRQFAITFGCELFKNYLGLS